VTPSQGGDWGSVTEAGIRAAADTRGRQTALAVQRLGVELHSSLADRVRPQFLLGDYELAAFAAMKEVEVRVRDEAGLPNSLIGVKLMQEAFRDGAR
jgi:hypothetical protein